MDSIYVDIFLELVQGIVALTNIFLSTTNCIHLVYALRRIQAVLMAYRVTGQIEAWYNLEDKVVLLTGVSAGLGGKLCTDLDKASCCILTAARRVDRL